MSPGFRFCFIAQEHDLPARVHGLKRQPEGVLVTRGLKHAGGPRPWVTLRSRSTTSAPAASIGGGNSTRASAIIRIETKHPSAGNQTRTVHLP
jgi:hypothetical protein